MAFDFENGSYTDAAGRTALDPAVYKDWQIGAAAEQAAQCVTAEQLVEKYARADVLTDEMAECMVEAVLVGRPERQRRPVPLEIRWRF